ncbi:MAG: hypothetical protein AAF851_05670 [Myxococcota bacterium]
MARRSRQPFIKIGYDDSEITKGLKRSVNSFLNASTAINQSLELVGKAYRLVAGSVGAFAGAIDNLIDLASEQERAERRAIAAIRLRGQFTEENFQSLQRFNGAIQQSIGVGDEQLLQLQGTLAALGVMPGELENATRATIGLAEATGSDFNSAARLAARALGGQVSALTRYGISAKDAGDAQRQLNGLFAIAEANGQTLATRLAVLEANTGDFQEVLGQAVTRSGSLSASIDSLSGFVIELQNIFGSEEGVKAVNTFFGAIAKGLAGTINGMLGAIKMAEDFRATVRRGLGLSTIGDVTPLNEDGTARGPTSGGGSLAAIDPALRESLEALENLANSLTAAAGTGVSVGRPGASRTGGGIIPSGGGDDDQKKEGSFFGPIVEQLEIQFDSMINLARFKGQQLSRTVQNELQEMGLIGGQEIITAGDILRGAAEQMVGSLGSVLSGLGSTIGGALSGAEGSMKRFIAGIIGLLGDLMIQVGTAALTLSPLAVIPGFQAFGAGSVLGPVAIAGGVALKAVSAALGGGGQSSAAQRTAATGAGSAVGNRQLIQGGGVTNRTVNVNLFGGLLVDRRMRRTLQDQLEAEGA